MASAREIPPGGEGKIEVTFKPKENKKESNITVTTNDPGQKTVELKVRASVHVVLATKPGRINFGRLKKGSPSSKYVSLKGADKDSVKITSVQSKNKHIEVETNPEGFESDKQKKIKISVLPGMKAGKFRDRVTIYTDHEKINKLVLYVYGEVLGNIIVDPNHLLFGMFKKGEAVEKIITLRAASDTTFEVLDVKSTIPEIVTRSETIREGKEYKIKVLLKENFNKDVLKGKVIIKTDDKEQENIDIKVFGRALKKSGQS